MKERIDFSWLPSGDAFQKVAMVCLESVCCAIPHPPKPLDIVSDEHWQPCYLQLKEAIIKAATGNMSVQQFEKYLSEQVDSIAPSDASFLFNAVQERKLDVKRGFVNDTLRTVPTAVTDFDWNVKYGVSSSKVLQLNEPLLTLSLSHGEENHRLLATELTENQLDELLHKLREAQSKLLKIK